MINEIVAACDVDLAERLPSSLSALTTGDRHARTRALARLITGLESGRVPPPLVAELHASAASLRVPTLGVTGTGGAGKSSLTDELVRRFRLDQDDALRIAIVSIDPSRRKSGGALLGDRIRMNAIAHTTAPRGTQAPALVIDDHPIVLQGCRRVLEDAGIERIADLLSR